SNTPSTGPRAPLTLWSCLRSGSDSRRLSRRHYNRIDLLELEAEQGSAIADDELDTFEDTEARYLAILLRKTSDRVLTNHQTDRLAAERDKQTSIRREADSGMKTTGEERFHTVGCSHQCGCQRAMRIGVARRREEERIGARLTLGY